MRRSLIIVSLDHPKITFGAIEHDKELKNVDRSGLPPRYQSVRKKLFDEDEDERDQSKSNASRNGSRRTQVLSGKKEVQRAKAAAEIQRFRAKGLDAVNFDSDEEYEVSEDDDDDDEEEDNDGDIDGFIVDDDEEEEEEVAESDDDEVVPLKRTSPPRRRDIVSAPKKPTRRASTTPKSPRRSSSALLPRSVPSAETRKAFSEYRGGRESDDERYASDMDDFIVADDASMDDAAQGAAASESDDAEMDGVVANSSDDDNSVGGPASRKNVVHTKSPPVKPSKSKSTSQRKTVVLLSDEEDADQGDEETPHVSKSTKKRRVRRTLFSASDDDDADEGSTADDQNGEGHGDEDEDDGEVDDGPLLYWKLNAQMDEAADGGNDSDDLDVAGQLFSMNHKYTLEEAFAKYLELLGKVLISPSFRQQIQERSLSRHKMVAYEKASRQIENLVCTHRESLLGSSAWQGDFLQELQHRPFYMCPQSTVAGAAAAGYCSDDHRCAACGRAAKEAFFNVYLHGPSYDGMAIWSQKWVQSLPTCIFLNPDDEEDAEDVDDFDAVDCADRNRRLSGNKRGRNHRYLSYEDAAEAAEQGQPLVNGDGADDDEDGDSDDDEDSSVAEAFQHRHKRNKQFSAFQQRHGASATVALSSALKTPSASSAATTTTTKKRSRAESAMGLDDDVVEDNDDHGDGEEDAIEMRKSSNKKRRVVILSESEHDDDDDDDDAEGKDEIAARRSRGYDSSLSSRRPTPAKPNSGDAADVVDMTDADDRPTSTTATSASGTKWWNKALPRALNQESETRWELSIHCKNRTNLYHTLLHYKFRLLLKIREQLERLHQRQSEGAYAGLTLEELPPAYVSSLLRDLLDPYRRHRSFVVQETDRLQVLLRTAEKRYGGDKYETQVDIWGTETLSINSSRAKSSSSSSSLVRSSSSSSYSTSAAAPVFSAKTTRQLKLIKKDFRTTSTGSSSASGISVMGEPRRAVFQSRISSWLTPKN